MTASTTISLDDEQMAAVEHGTGPALVLAGAGSGKTRVLTERVARLVEQGVDPAKIMVSTFTNKATEEMRDRLEQRIGTKATDLCLGTLHSLCWRLVKSHDHPDGRYPRILKYPDTAMNHVLEPRTNRNPNGLRDRGVDKGCCTVSAALRFVDGCKEHLLTPDALLEHVEDQQLFHRLAGSEFLWRKHFRQAGLKPRDAADLYACFECEKGGEIDFGDMALRLWLAWQRDPAFSATCTKSFSHVLVDEFQDVSFAQWEIIRHLAPQNLFAVGDDWQAVYSFRFATPEYILRFEEFYTDATLYPIGTNYRSIPAVVSQGAGLIAVNRVQRKKQVRPAREDEGEVSLASFRAAEAEGEFVAETIREWIDEGFDATGCACIYRVNRYSALIELALIEQGIPYRILGGLPFFKWRVVADMLAYLRLAADHTDRKSFERALRAPNRFLGRAFIDQVYTQGGKDLVSAARSSTSNLNTRQADAATTFCGLIEWLTKRSGENPASMIHHVRDFTRYDHWAGGTLLNDEEGSTDRLPDLDTLEQVASRYETADELLAYVDLVLSDDNQHGVTLCSVHRAKGLEWDRVFLCGSVASLFPHRRAMEEADDATLAAEEERRLFYVAMTRAKDRLLVTYPDMAFGRLQAPSPFLVEAGLTGNCEKFSTTAQTATSADRADDPTAYISQEASTQLPDSPNHCTNEAQCGSCSTLVTEKTTAQTPPSADCAVIALGRGEGPDNPNYRLGQTGSGSCST